MIVGHLPERLPIALAVATSHEAQIVQRALRIAAVTESARNAFEIVQVGVSCCNLNLTSIDSAYGGIISIGFAGALEPSVISGTLVLPNRVKTVDNTVFDVEPNLQQMIATTVQANAVSGVLLHTEILLTSIDQKRNAFEKYRCVACDMESASLAAAALKAKKPFACLRIILDPANIVIPTPVIKLTESSSEPSAAAFVVAVCRHPGQLPATIAFLWHTFRASRALSRSVTQFVQGCNL